MPRTNDFLQKDFNHCSTSQWSGIAGETFHFEMKKQPVQNELKFVEYGPLSTSLANHQKKYVNKSWKENWEISQQAL